MTHHASDTTDEPGKSKGNLSIRDRQMWLILGAAVAVVGALIFAASRVSTNPWHVVLVVLAVLASLYAAYMVGIFAFLLFVVWMVEEYGKPQASRPWPFRFWPIWVWPIVTVLGLPWLLWAAFAGYEAYQWLWQGISIYGGILVILLVFFRRHR